MRPAGAKEESAISGKHLAEDQIQHMIASNFEVPEAPINQFAQALAFHQSLPCPEQRRAPLKIAVSLRLEQNAMAGLTDLNKPRHIEGGCAIYSGESKPCGFLDHRNS